MSTVPRLDERSTVDVTSQLVALLEEYTTYPKGSAGGYAFEPWREYDPITRQPIGMSAALVGVFTRFAEIVIDRLNQVPEKNFAAFLDMLGASSLPPEPSRVPLTFSLAPGRLGSAEVPAGTRVAAPPEQGEKEPVVFETQRPVSVTPARLAAITTLDPATDTDDVRGNSTGGESVLHVFRGSYEVERTLYLGDSRLLGYSNITQLSVNVTLAEELPDSDPRRLRWEIWNESEWVALEPRQDTTNAMRQSGRIQFGSCQPLLQCAVNDIKNRWLRCRLVTPVTLSSTRAAVGMVRANQLPVLENVELVAHVERAEQQAIVPDCALADSVLLDLNAPLYPFGDREKLCPSFYVACLEAFSGNRGIGDATVTLHVELAETISAAGLKLVWEYWTELGWVAALEVLDGTAQLTKNGTVQLTISKNVAKTSIAGLENYWIRARITAGDFGKDAHYEPQADPPGYQFVLSTFKPPLITKLRISYEFEATRMPESCMTTNQREFEDMAQLMRNGGGSWMPFAPAKDQEQPGFYLGLVLPNALATFPNSAVSMYACVDEPRYGEQATLLGPEFSRCVGEPGAVVAHKFVLSNHAEDTEEFLIAAVGQKWAVSVSDRLSVEPGGTLSFDAQVSIPNTARYGDNDRGFLRLSGKRDPHRVHVARFLTSAGESANVSPRLVWQYWNGVGWARLVLICDETESLTRSGEVEFLAPRDFASHRRFGENCYWLRVLWQDGDYRVWPRLRQLLLNTTTALQGTSITGEILGASSGTAAQTFRATRAPVLLGQQLEVKEPEKPNLEEQEILRREEGDGAIRTVVSPVRRTEELWIRWHEVPDFYASGPHDRHYVLNRLSGEIRFGDGTSGRIPPRGLGNIRLASYRSGGGANGNRTANKVTQLKTTVPYIEKVTNPEAATGGADAESTNALSERVPLGLRHRDRAVTLEDFEDLAKTAVPEVARARCVPLRNLVTDPLGKLEQPGMVSIIVVPRTTEGKPLPSLESLERIRAYLGARAPATAAVVVVGPLYVRVDVHAEIAVAAAASVSVVETELYQRLGAFLHPLSGGADGKGWGFGRAPHRSDFYSLFEQVPGVDHVRHLQILDIEDGPGARQSGNFLVYSGQHRIDLVFNET